MNTTYLNVLITIIAITLVGSFFVQFCAMFIALALFTPLDNMDGNIEYYAPIISQDVADVEYWVSP